MGGISNKFARDVFEKAQDVCSEFGAQCRLDKGRSRGHARLIIALNGRERFTPLSSSPSSPFAIRHKILDVRKIIQELQS